MIINFLWYKKLLKKTHYRFFHIRMLELISLFDKLNWTEERLF